MTYNRNFIFIIESEGKSLHIHTWTGDEVVRISSQGLGLTWDERINMVHVGHQGVLHVAVWDDKKRAYTRIVTYKVCILLCFSFIYTHIQAAQLYCLWGQGQEDTDQDYYP